MNEIPYIGERTWAGEAGHLLVIIAFVFALLSAYSYFKASSTAGLTGNWKLLGRISFYIHGLGLFAAIGLIFYMLVSKYYEYQYVWQHSNSEMPMKFIFACFWEGQEGSFLLWAFWHVVLGLVLLFTAKSWESPVMATFTLVQAFLCSMVIGGYFIGYKWGTSPFLLVREMPENLGMPWTSMPDYLELPLFKDGRGLNPLLQNYWMTIHPPTLFLGFALTLVPFCYAIAGLWKKQFTEWIRPALSWTFTGVAVLGIGILMGGAWAYEALSFGGFWAWDPVENASLVPWIILVAGGHVMILSKNKNRASSFAFILILSAFILVLYSTFLTRSGILGDSSVHSFTDLGMYWQLVIFLLTFLSIGVVLLIMNSKALKADPKGDSPLSREFWMFIAALVLTLSAFHISFTTSFPVFNKFFGTSWATPEVKDYNIWQGFFAIALCMLIGIGQFFKYKQTDPILFRKKILRSITASLLIGVFLSFLFGWIGFQVTLLWSFLLITGIFAVLANADHFLATLKGKFDHAGPSIAHIGFGLVLVGALISTGKSKVISQSNRGTFDFLGPEFSDGENVLLTRDDTVRMGEYFVAYRGKELQGNHVAFNVDYFRFDSLKGTIQKEFSLSPFIQLNERMGNSAEPDTRHYFHKDIYTHIRYAELTSLTDTTSPGNYGPPSDNTAKAGDTIQGFHFYMVLEKFISTPDTAKFKLGKAEIAVGAQIKVVDFFKRDTIIMPVYYIEGDKAGVIEAEVGYLGLKVAMWKIDPETGLVNISFVRKKRAKDDFVVMKAVEFPAINLLWTGCLVMFFGTLLAVRKRIKNQKKEENGKGGVP